MRLQIMYHCAAAIKRREESRMWEMRKKRMKEEEGSNHASHVQVSQQDFESQRQDSLLIKREHEARQP